VIKRIRPARSVLAGVFAATLLSSSAFAQETTEADTAAPQAPSEFSAAVAGLSPHIQDVQIVGPWSSGDEHGVWRTIMVQPAGENAKTHFFIQQLDASGHSGLSVKSTAEITEIANVDGVIVGYRADEPSESQPNSLSLFFDIVPYDGEISETYELHYLPGEPYIFGPATN